MATGIIPKNATLLWTNPSPRASFDTQSVELDLSKYNAVYCTFVQSSSMSTKYEQPALVFLDGVDTKPYLLMRLHESTCYVYVRAVSANSTSVTFSYCTRRNLRSTSTATDNSYMIPKCIYGIRF